MTQSGAAEPLTPSPEPAIPVAPGQVIGERYLIGSVIGEGGMGVVCAATHIGLGTPVAVKLIRPDLKHDAESVVRFVNEARAAAALKGEHIARVYDVGQLETGEPYLVMEQLEGVALDAFLSERGSLAQTEAVDIVLQACEGLAEAHAAGLVHRDVKPANLYLARRPDGQFVLKILDFGISKRLMDEAWRGVTNPGRSMGSPWYMSPEQMMNPAAVDQRADVWSLGVLLYELLTNEYPFNGDGVVQVCANVLVAPAPRPSSRRGDIDGRLDEVVLRCLEKKPEDRFPSVEALAEALRPFSSRAAQVPSNLALTDPLPIAASPEPVFVATQLKQRSEKSAGVSQDTNRACVRELATAESFAPLSGEPHPAHSRRSVLATAGVSLLIGAVLTWLGWPYLHAEYNAAETHFDRAAWPWDPVLNEGPEAAPLARDIHVPQLLAVRESAGNKQPVSLPRATEAEEQSHSQRSVPEINRERIAPPRGSGSAAPSSDSQELRRRLEQYETWLHEQGLTRIQEHPQSEPAPAPSATMPTPPLPPATTSPTTSPEAPPPAAPVPKDDLPPNPYDNDEEP